MQKQKKGFWLFIFSLIPGAGELYMGFKKQGLSIMLLFYSLFAIGAGTGMDWIIMFFPIVWFYSFFNVHNLKSLSEEEFYAIEDSYILHLDEFLGSTNVILTKYRLVVAILMITLGVSLLWNAVSDVLYWILPGILGDFVQSIGYMLPQIVLAVCIILGGLYLLKNKKELFTKSKDEQEDEHFWQPYRPHTADTDSFGSGAAAKSAAEFSMEAAKTADALGEDMKNSENNDVTADSSDAQTVHTADTADKSDLNA